MRRFCVFLLLVLSLPLQAQSLFSSDERTRLVAFWNESGRYRPALPTDALKKGPWKVRLTPEASTWFLTYQIAIVAAKAPPTQDAKAATPETVVWEKWIEAKLAYDRAKAQQTADAANLFFLGKAAPDETGENATRRGNLSDRKRRRDSGPKIAPDETIAVTVPGPIPEGLRAAVGNPPAFANVVTPMEHTVTFEDGDAYTYPDNVLMRPRYAYYRFPQGTVAYGPMLKEMPDDELTALFAEAGFTPAEQRIAKAVSRLEGGFETINTYDTGFVSIGFIQFITYDDGKQSLIEVLQRERTDRPAEYEKDFRRYGMDVNVEGAIVVVDPATGAELAGAEAVKKIIEDKRLTAIFQRAGRHSKAFRIAQIQIARAHYWPAEDPIAITVNGTTCTGKACDVIKSEAGMATLFDRKVNRGKIYPFSEVLTKVMTARKLTTLAQAAAYEQEIVAALKYRTDFLADKTLGQPKPCPTR